MAALHDRSIQAAASSSVNATQTVTQLVTDAGPFSLPDGTLRLRAASVSADDRRVMWAEDVVDNEGMGKKKSKVCCIYHKPRAVDESSSEDSSSSDSSSDSDSGPSTPRNDHQKKHHHHSHGDDRCGRGHGVEKGKGKGKAGQRKRSPNAYEKMTKPSGRKKA
ncbi:hypothetical protein FGG08_001169 [Glutinoglossum americanum]|uniref:Type 1 phosphatases regulator n=1 Tax=Glutinoglossum americanum TaxID=1670608 RepID=A0A9P8L5I6_9PEZI|nr:hypothetical protein FGG08_001169 [Glutinoglossum americanum]